MMLKEYISKNPTILNDPFKVDKVVSVRVSSYKSPFGREIIHRGTVEFENGNTKGEQIFTGSSFDDVVLQIKSFIDTL